MTPRRVLAILVKDLRDALRDGRILIVLLLPIGLAVFWHQTAPDEDERPTTTVAVVDPARIGLAAELRQAAARSVEVTTRAAPDARAARRLVDADTAAFAVVARRSESGSAPARADVLVPENATPTAQSVVALVPDAFAAAARRPPTIDVRLRSLPVAASDRRPFDLVDQPLVFVVVGVTMLLAFVALMVVPMQTAEEIGTGTFGALRLAATGPEILAAKALCGLLFAAAGTAVTLLLTGADPHEPLRFYAAALALAVSLVGFGLLLGLASGNANQINTYGGFLVFPVMAITFAVLFVESPAVKLLFDVLPFSQGARILFDAISPAEPFGTGPVAWAVLAGWCVLGFAVLARVASRREV